MTLIPHFIFSRPFIALHPSTCLLFKLPHSSPACQLFNELGCFLWTFLLLSYP